MSRQEDTRLVDYLYGELSEGEAEEYRRALDSDPAAKQELDEYASLLGTVRSIDTAEEPSPHLDSLILANARQAAEQNADKGARAWLRKLFRTPVAGLAVAATLAAFVAVLVPVTSSFDDAAPLDGVAQRAPVVASPPPPPSPAGAPAERAAAPAAQVPAPIAEAKPRARELVAEEPALGGVGAKEKDLAANEASEEKLGKGANGPARDPEPKRGATAVARAKVEKNESAKDDEAKAIEQPKPPEPEPRPEPRPEPTREARSELEPQPQPPPTAPATGRDDHLATKSGGEAVAPPAEAPADDEADALAADKKVAPAKPAVASKPARPPSQPPQPSQPSQSSQSRSSGLGVSGDASGADRSRLSVHREAEGTKRESEDEGPAAARRNQAAREANAEELARSFIRSADTYVAQGDPESARNALITALTRVANTPSYGAVAFRIAELDYAAGRFPQAIAYAKAAAMTPGYRGRAAAISFVDRTARQIGSQADIGWAQQQRASQPAAR